MQVGRTSFMPNVRAAVVYYVLFILVSWFVVVCYSRTPFVALGERRSIGTAVPSSSIILIEAFVVQTLNEAMM